MRFLNIKFPIEDSNEGFIFKSDKSQREIVKSNLLLLLLTEKGQVYYNPKYGTNLKQFLFEPNDQITDNQIEEHIRDVIGQFAPKITINNIVFDNDYRLNQDENAIIIDISFTYTEDYFTFSDTVSISFADFN